MPKKPKQRTIRFNNRDFHTIGGETAFWSDFYHRSMTASLPTMLATGLALFVLNNLFFAMLYAFDSGSVSNVLAPRFLNLFFFSIEAFTTVGFGDMHPANTWGHMVFSLEGFMSVVETAALTGLIFARFSKPKARILFADNPVVGNYDGHATLMFRLANARQNFISDATVQLWILRDEFTKGAPRFRRFHEVPLARQQNPSFILSWTLFHAINKQSILYGLSAADLAEKNYQFILTIKGVDDTSSQELRARKAYGHEQVLWGRHYVDILEVGENGITLDYRKFNETRPDIKIS
jgi:inward rectifier potassium channel